MRGAVVQGSASGRKGLMDENLSGPVKGLQGVVFDTELLEELECSVHATDGVLL